MFGFPVGSENCREIFMDTFWSYMSKQFGMIKTVHILSCSVDCQTLSHGDEELSVSSTTQDTQTMSGEQTGTVNTCI